MTLLSNGNDGEEALADQEEEKASVAPPSRARPLWLPLAVIAAAVYLLCMFVVVPRAKRARVEREARERIAAWETQIPGWGTCRLRRVTILAPTSAGETKVAFEADLVSSAAGVVGGARGAYNPADNTLAVGFWREHGLTGPSRGWLLQ